jgi:hypothetical protein
VAIADLGLAAAGRAVLRLAFHVRLLLAGEFHAPVSFESGWSGTGRTGAVFENLSPLVYPFGFRRSRQTIQSCDLRYSRPRATTGAAQVG